MNAPSVVVSGMIAATPRQGGAAWAVLQYLLGLRRLGCDVHFVEPVDRPRLADSDSARYCDDVMRRFGLDGRWALIGPDGDDEIAGMTRQQLRDVARAADVLLNVSGMCTDQDVLEAIDTRVYLDLDPGFVQLWHASGIDMRFDVHTHFVSIADAIGRAECPVPTCGRDWIATLPPVVLGEWPVAVDEPVDALTTVAHWRGYGSIVHDGVQYGQKAHSLRPLFDLPTRTTAELRLALAIDDGDADDLAQLRANGWSLVDPATVAATPDEYRRFVQCSWAELGIAKSGYVASRAGWFSDRSACYLASGRPVIAQDTGFGRRLPTGDGLFAFTDADDVVGAVEALRADYPHHAGAARAVAEVHLDSDRVLDALLDAVLP